MPVLYLAEQGATIRKKGDTLVVTKNDSDLQVIPASKVDQVVIFGNVNITTPVIHYLLDEGKDCVFCSSTGRYHGRLFSTESKYGLLRRAQFEAVTTQGNIKLEDFKGTWLVMFSHPADFTPVCTTEFIAFAEIHSKLREINCELMGLSIDSVSSHIAWIRNIEAIFGVKVEFPIIADSNKEVASKYGMLMPGESKTETSRCVFIIDDKQIIRTMIYYPLTTGRNMEEILRVIIALQTTDKNGVATPANWKPGDKVICINDNNLYHVPVRCICAGLIYTVSEVFRCKCGNVYIRLDEVYKFYNMWCPKCNTSDYTIMYFHIERFRPLE